MSDINFLEMAAICREKLAADGYRIRAVEDFRQISEIVSILGKPYLTPKLSPFLNDFTPQNCFWLLLEKGDQLIAAGGCRFDDLGDMPLSQFWMNTIDRHYGDQQRGLIDVSSSVDDALHGRLAYFGDLIVEKGKSGGLRVLKRFTHIAQAYAALKFRPDFSYSFVTARDVRRGAMDLYGFNTLIHDAQTWRNPPHYHSNDDLCIYVGRRYLQRYAATCVSLPEKL